MARYIDADLLEKAIDEAQTDLQSRSKTDMDWDMNKPYFKGLCWARALLNEQPTAAVAEVKHGYWKDRYGNKYDNHLYECSVCGEKALYKFYKNELMQEESRQALTPTCPHCGVKMDGERRRCSNDNNTI